RRPHRMHRRQQQQVVPLSPTTWSCQTHCRGQLHCQKHQCHYLLPAVGCCCWLARSTVRLTKSLVWPRQSLRGPANRCDRRRMWAVCG
ncbi:hypothetical protein H4R27_006527, partial [Coemansia aciculifera]